MPAAFSRVTTIRHDVVAQNIHPKLPQFDYYSHEPLKSLDQNTCASCQVLLEKNKNRTKEHVEPVIGLGNKHNIKLSNFSDLTIPLCRSCNRPSHNKAYFISKNPDFFTALYKLIDDNIKLFRIKDITSFNEAFKKLEEACKELDTIVSKIEIIDENDKTIVKNKLNKNKYVINPKTNKRIVVNGKTYNELIKKGVKPLSIEE